MILFGEWCTARHSVAYDLLPDWFVAFDVYDRRSRRFWSTARRDALCEQLGLPVVPALAVGMTSLSALRELLDNRSRYGADPIEGLVVRRDEEKWLRIRAKLVHPDFTQSLNEHWRRRTIVWNRITTTGHSS